MITPLYLDLQKTHGKVMNNQPFFFQLCVEHLGFLIAELGFVFDCHYFSQAESFIKAEFSNQKLPLVFVVMWCWDDLPILGIGPVERKYFERSLLPKLNNEDAEYSLNRLLEQTSRKDETGRRQIIQQHEERVAERIKQIGIWVRESYSLLVV